MKKFRNVFGLLMLAPLALAGFIIGLDCMSVQAEATVVHVEFASAPFSKMQWRFSWHEVLEIIAEKDGQMLVLRASMGNTLRTGVNPDMLDRILKHYGLVMSDLRVISHNHNLIEAGVLSDFEARALSDFSPGDYDCMKILRKKGFKGTFRLYVVDAEGGMMVIEKRQQK